MEYIEGQNLFQIKDEDLKKRIIELRDKEISLARRMGFQPIDQCYFGNTI